MVTHLNPHFIHYLLERASKDKSKLIFAQRSGEYKEWRYPALWTSVKSYAASLQNNGITEGDVVAIILPTCKEFVISFFAIQLLKAVPMAVYPPMNLAGLVEWNAKTGLMLKSVDTKLAITDQRIHQAMGMVGTAGFQVSRVLVDELEEKMLDFLFDIESFNEHQLCFLQFSSGTTGEPKAVKISQANAILNAQIISDALPVPNPLISVASWLPLYHDMGLVGCLLMSILNGTDLVLIRPDDFMMRPELWLKAIHDYRITCTTAPNFSYGLLQKRVSPDYLKQLDLSCLEAALCGAEMVHKETMHQVAEHLKVARFNPKSLLPVYGMAEATLAVTFTDKTVGISFLRVDADALAMDRIIPASRGVEICCVGDILPTFSVRIVDEREQDLNENNVGRILIKGPCVSSGYYNDEEKTASCLNNGWLDTGDQGFLHQERLYICGRLKDIMVIRGSNYYPTLYEEKIQRISGLRKGRVIVSSSLNSHSGTEEVVVLAEVNDHKRLKGDSTRIKKEIAQMISIEGLPLFKVGLVGPGTLSKTSSGKVQRRKNIELWFNNQLGKDKKFNALSIWRNVTGIIYRTFLP